MKYLCQNCGEECGMVFFVKEFHIWICKSCWNKYLKGRLITKTTKSK